MSRRDTQKRATAPERPRSAASFGLCLIALGVGLALIWAIAPAQNLAALSFVPYAPLIPCAGIVLVIALGERIFPTLRARSAGGFAAQPLRARHPGRIAVRLLGLVLTLMLVMSAYWLFPEYHGDFYLPYWRFLRSIAYVGALIPWYFWWADAYLAEERDEYLAFGSALLGESQPGDRALIRRHLLGWTVKAFFLPLMTVYLINELRDLYGAIDTVTTRTAGGESLLSYAQTMPLYLMFYHLSYVIDLLFCVVGYSAAMRLFDSEIRSAEPTMSGWVAALICYQPFVSVIGRFYLQYEDDIYWDGWLQAWPAIQAAWAVAIVLLASTYAICTVAFGLRFSNLTHRGIITSGPYRFSKHPAYLAKNLSWWLISIPFVSAQGPAAALRNCSLLALMNLVYYARAKTEERHLSRDPTYVEYALWMNEHGALRALGRWMPFLRYQAPPVPSSAAIPAPLSNRGAAR